MGSLTRHTTGPILHQLAATGAISLAYRTITTTNAAELRSIAEMTEPVQPSSACVCKSVGAPGRYHTTIVTMPIWPPVPANVPAKINGSLPI